MINIADILKDCPKGTKLYSSICGNCKLLKIYNGLGFDVINDTNEVFNFSYDGRYNLNGECCIFPSKEQRDWSKFQRHFNDGDIVFYSNTIAIFKEWGDETLFRTYCVFYTSVNKNIFSFELDRPLFGKSVRKEIRFATDEEKQKLFDAIKANGYKWNAETKILEKLIEPKFKVGDKITNGKVTIKIGHIDGDYYYDITRNIANRLFINFQDEWELLVTTPKFKVGDKIKNRCGGATYRIIGIVEDGYEIDCFSFIPFSIEDSYELVPNKFDISTLKAYDKVLVRDDNNSAWINTFFGFYDTVTNKKYPFIAGSVNWAQCIPYESNEHLLGTCNECNEYYKNW